MNELWKRIEGFEDYEVSSMGRVRSYKNGKCIILKERLTKDGYVQYVLSDRLHKSKTKRANRLVAEAFIPNPLNKSTVNHIDGNKLNNDFRNLEWATKEEQMQHAYKLGLKKPIQGTMHERAVLTEEQVIEIRSIYKPRSKEFGMRALAIKYGVSDSTIDKCVRRKSYQNVK